MILGLSLESLKRETVHMSVYDKKYVKGTVVERLAHWTPDQKAPGSNPTGGLDFRVSESVLSTAP